MKPPRLVYIEWHDACSNTNGWESEQAGKRWARETEWIVREVGFILHESKKSITLMGHYEPGSAQHQASVGNLQKIPKTWIRVRVDLTEHIAKARK